MHFYRPSVRSGLWSMRFVRALCQAEIDGEERSADCACRSLQCLPNRWMGEPDNESGAGAVGEWRNYSVSYGLPDVLQAALTAFVEFGYHGTSVRTIASRAGLSVPGLYHHYRSKGDILALLLDQSGEEVLRRAREARDEAEPNPAARLRNLIENIVLYMSYRQQLAHLTREMRCLDEKRFRHHVGLRDKIEQMFLAEIVAGNESGIFVVHDPLSAMRAILVMCRGVADWYSVAGSLSPEAIAAQYVRFSFDILRSRV